MYPHLLHRPNHSQIVVLDVVLDACDAYAGKTLNLGTVLI